jgi:hypothetical protein
LGLIVAGCVEGQFVEAFLKRYREVLFVSIGNPWDEPVAARGPQQFDGCRPNCLQIAFMCLRLGENVPIIDLAPAFTLEDAREAGLRKDQVYALLEQGEIERVGRGVYVHPDLLDPAFMLIAAATAIRGDATLCLTSALVHHDLSDAIPFGSDIALPRGARHPANIMNVTWHSFDPSTFAVGREQVQTSGGATVAIYSAERTIVDCFRLMHQEGSDVAHQALKRWLKGKGNTAATLLKVAALFPKSLPRIRQALEVLL